MTLSRQLAGGGRPLLGLMVLALLIRLALLVMVTGMPCSHDQCDYLDLAGGVADGLGLATHDGYLWPPGFIAFLAFCKALVGDNLLAPRLLQVLLSTATVPLIFILGLRFHGRVAGLAAAAVFTVYPNLVGFTHLLWPATLYIFLFILGITLLLGLEAPTRRHVAAAGICLGLAALVRGQALYFAPLAAVWLVLAAAREERRRRLGLAALLVAFTLLPILPWTLRNAATYHRFLLLDSTTGHNLYIGTNVPPPSNWDYGFDERRRVHGGRPRCAQANIVDADRCEVRNAVAFMASHPGLMLKRVPLKWADLINPSSFVIRHARLDKYPHIFSRPALSILTMVAAGAWMAVAILGVLGLTLLPPWTGRGLVITLLLYHLSLHALTFGMTRFRLPMVPFLILAGAPLLVGSWRQLAAAGNARRVVAAGLLAALLALWIARFSRVFDVFLPL
ncbi:MAG: glycosyltransferase family 39 protein [Acidobacteria bacterium]|nr:glycosyltransferase family 39 protein [Acidobacteriota bacterium]